MRTPIASVASSVIGLLGLVATGCSVPAHADGPTRARAYSPQIAIAVAPTKVRAPYDVQIIREDGESLPTYAHRGRYYVQGNANERYVIRVTNPTPNRVEAVVSVDGLDVVDGESGDLRKRGYVVPAYGDVRIEGFRTSQEDVATFRFSSVSNSYAGRKGKARNVGVIAVAIFEEQAQREPEQQIIVGGGTYGGRYDYEDDLADRSMGRGEATASRSVDSGGGKAAAKRAPAAPPSADATSATGGAPAPAPRHFDAAEDADMEIAPSTSAAPPVMNRERPGLGTEFGESRYSAASFTRFVRAANRPIAIAELRYNDTAGLVALGIHVQPLPDEAELMTRETADPFPGDHRFATPPR